MSDVKEFFFKRRDEHGALVKWRFLINPKTMEIVREDPVRGDGTVAPARPEMDHEALRNSPRLQELRRRGIKFHLEGSSILIDKVPQKEVLTSQFFLEGAPDPIDDIGLSKFRKQYFAERKELLDSGCRGCDLASLERKYRDVVERRIDLYLKDAGKSKHDDSAGHRASPGPVTQAPA